MRFLSLLAAIAVVTGLSLVSVHAQQGNFVLIYTFDRDEGSVAKDLSGKGNDGQITDAVWTADGKFGGGMEFNGTTSLIEVPHDNSLNPGGDQITVMAWYKPLSFPGGHPPIARKGQVGAGVEPPSLPGTARSRCLPPFPNCCFYLWFGRDRL